MGFSSRENVDGWSCKSSCSNTRKKNASEDLGPNTIVKECINKIIKADIPSICWIESGDLVYATLHDADSKHNQ